jgi:murein DD-endopeptidase MepM/ murein hydrolase activator NlpD
MFPNADPRAATRAGRSRCARLSRPSRRFRPLRLRLTIAAFTLVAAATGCGNNGDVFRPANADTPSAPAAVLTPILMRVDETPVPVLGSDGRYHVVYELEVANFTREAVTLERLEMLAVDTGSVVSRLEDAGLAERLSVNDATAVPRSLGAAQLGLLSIHLVFDQLNAIPTSVDHRLSVIVGTRPALETAARTRIAAPTELVLDSPLRGSRYIAGDGCCDSHRHVRATLPINGRLVTSQRFAIDWEQLDEQGRIFAGDPKDLASYVIYGKPVFAVADGRVVEALDGMPDTPPGSFPEGITLAEADGNHVVLELEEGHYVLFAHLQPGSVQVRKGQQVRRGELLGRVGSSGNSSEPHLHFHVTAGPSPMASNGLPHRLRQFGASLRGVSTEAFDQAIIDGRPIATEPVAPPGQRENVLPLDLWIVDFPE